MRRLKPVDLRLAGEPFTPRFITGVLVPLASLLVVSQSALAQQAQTTATSATSSIRPIDLPTTKLIEAIVRQSDETGRVDGRYLQAAVDRGAEAILAAAENLDASRPKRSGLLYGIIARAGIRRNAPAELLRLYDPVAHRLYYQPAGKREQAKIAAALFWDKPPSFLPQAVVRAAPVATLTWMADQATSDRPRVELLVHVLDEWSRWVAQRHERQHVERLREVLRQLSASAKISANPSSLPALLRCAGAARGDALTEFAVDCLGHGDATVRSAACQSLGRLGGAKALAGLTGRVDPERDPTVLANLAAALQAFPDEPQASSAALRLFRTSDDQNVRRQLLFSLIESRWQDRDRMLAAAFESGQGSVVAVALSAIDGNSPKATRDRVVKLAQKYAIGPPPLVDALGAIADDRGTPWLVKWFVREKNAAFRLKIVLALENIGSTHARKALAEFIEQESNEDVMVYLVRAAGRLKIAESRQTIIDLAESSEIPLNVRAEAIWALGQFDSSDVRASLRRMANRPEAFFGNSPKGDPTADEAGLLDQATLYVQLSRLKLGEADAEKAVRRAYRDGTPLARMTAILVLGELGRDHPSIDDALDSPDFAVLLAAVRSAGKVAPRKYHTKLVALRDSPFIRQLLDSGLQDVETLRHFLHEAIEAGGTK